MAKKLKKDNTVRVLNVGKENVSEVSTVSNPVTEMAHKIQALLSYDYSVLTEFDYNEKTLWVYATDPNKVEAYKFFLVREHSLGNLTLNVKLMSIYQGKVEEVEIPTYKVKPAERVKLFYRLFSNSDLVPEHMSAIDQYDTEWNFFMFPNIGVMYTNDSLQNPYGHSTMLAADLVKEVFDASEFCISTNA